jgi:hypothetical protein
VTGTYGIFVSGKSHLTVLGGTFTSDGGDRTMFRCSTSGGSDILVSGWSYTGPSGGVSNFAIIGACTSITFENNTIDNIANGINQYEVSNNGPVIIRNNYIRDSVNNVTQSDIVNLGSTRNVLIEGNKFVQQAIAKTAGLHDDVLQTYAVGGSGQCPAGFTIRYNWVELNKTQSDSGDSSWSMFEAMCDGTSGFAVKFYSNVFDSGDNFFSGGNGYGCSTSTSSAHCYVYNNTMIRHNGPNGGVGGSGGASFYFSNNAGESDAGNTDGGDFNIGSGHYQQGAPYDHNWSYRLNGCDSSVSGPHGSCNTDPKFSDFAGHNYALQSSSPLVNAGDDTIGSEYNQGPCPGATWPNPTLCTRTAGHWDVGAYQSGGGDPPPDPPTGLNAQVN